MFQLGFRLEHMTNDTNGIPDVIEPSGFLTWAQVEEANAFDDSEPDEECDAGEVG